MTDRMKMDPNAVKVLEKYWPDLVNALMQQQSGKTASTTAKDDGPPLTNDEMEDLNDEVYDCISSCLEACQLTTLCFSSPTSTPRSTLSVIPTAASFVRWRTCRIDERRRRSIKPIHWLQSQSLQPMRTSKHRTEVGA